MYSELKYFNLVSETCDNAWTIKVMGIIAINLWCPMI